MVILAVSSIEVTTGVSVMMFMMVFVLATAVLLRDLESLVDLAIMTTLLVGFGVMIVWKVHDGFHKTDQR